MNEDILRTATAPTIAAGRDDFVDLKSDAMLPPTPEMWDAMRTTRVDWVLGGDDPNVVELEQIASRLLGKEAGLYLPTARMGVLVALMTYCGRGRQLIAGRTAHVVCCEEWGLSYVCGAYPRLVNDAYGSLDPNEIEEVFSESFFYHAPVTDLLCIENAHNGSGGRVTDATRTSALSEVAHRNGARVFVDGARILYAAAATGTPPSELVAPVDAVVLSLTKGLGAPQGAVLCGSRADIDSAAVNLRRLGGHSVPLAGVFAAAALIALRTHLHGLSNDIRMARRFATEIAGTPGLGVDPGAVETNIVMVDTADSGLTSAQYLAALEDRGVRGHGYDERTIRFIFHRGVADAGVDRAVSAVRSIAIGLVHGAATAGSRSPGYAHE